MKKKVEKYYHMNDEKIDKDIEELSTYIDVLEQKLKSAKDPIIYKKVISLKKEALIMIEDLEQQKLLNPKKRPQES